MTTESLSTDPHPSANEMTGPAPRPARGWRKWVARLRRTFSIDLRSLAVFRVALGSLILADLVLRSFDMQAFYTDAGVLPRRHWVELTNSLHLSLHAASGTLLWQIVLFVIAGLIALLLIVGYRTRLMSILSWVLLVSLVNRNGLILQGGDQLLVVMSFWAMFLPLGAYWSIDAALQPELRDNPNAHRYPRRGSMQYFSPATVAVIFQILYLYYFTAVLKSGDAWISRFDAAFYAVSLQHFATPVGLWISQFPGLLKLGTIYVLSVEFIAPFLVLAPIFWPWCRLAGLALLASLHVAFLLMLHIGLFPFIDFMALSLLLPTAAWVWLQQRRVKPEHQAIGMYYDEDCGFCLKMCLVIREFCLPRNVVIKPAQSDADMRTILEREYSWVITDGNGNHYTHWQAMQFVVSRRWPIKPLGWLMAFPPFMALGNRLYRAIGNNRSTMGEISARWLPYRSMRLKPRALIEATAIGFFIVVTIYNITGITQFRSDRPEWVRTLATVTRTDQHWNMFAPYPLTVSLYPIVPGTLRNGDTVELHASTRSDPDWTPPTYMYPLYESYRWRKYLGRVRSHKNNVVRRAFGDYQCRTWNTSDRVRDEQLGILRVHFVSLATNTRNEPKERKQSMVWRHWCYPEFKPAS